MSEIKVNSIKGVAASTAAITVNNTDGTCSANITNNLSNRNLIINGAMQVAQRSAGPNEAQGYGTVDRFKINYSGQDQDPSQAQVDVASGTTPYTLGFRKAYKIINGNQTSGAGAGDSISMSYLVEDQDLAQSGWNYLSATSYVTLSFWFKSSVNQTFYVILESKDGSSKQYSFAITPTGADTWTKVTHSIKGDSGIQFSNDNGEGIEIYFGLFYGTNLTTSGHTLNTWKATSSSNQAPDMTSTWYTTNDATWELTGVQLEVSDHATDFEHRSISDELNRCLRYCFVLPQSHQGTSPNSQYVDMHIYHPTIMRTKPTVTQVGAQNIGGYDSTESGTYSSRFYTNSGTPRLGPDSKFDAEL